MATPVENGEIKQIIIVTDGRSGLGISSIEAAKKVYNEGIAVSVIGISDQRNRSDYNDAEGLKKIAEAGGGLYEYSTVKDFERTVQNLTNKTARKTIEQIVSRQLKLIIREGICALEPESRFRITDFIEKHGENINLKCVVVLDTGGRTGDELVVIKKGVVELLKKLKTRKGSSCIAVIAYAGEGTGMCSVICSFTGEISILGQKLELISPGGCTPAGAAILKARELLYRYYEACGSGESGEYETLKYYI